MKEKKKQEIPKRIAILSEAFRLGRPVRIKSRAKTDEKLEGFVVGLSDTFVLLHALDGGHRMVLNGYTALPLPQIKEVRILDDHDSFVERALRVRNIRPQSQPDILLLDFPGLLSSADAHFPLITLHLELLWPDCCFIGRVQRLTKRTVRLRKINPAARWVDVEKFYFSDITRVEFGGGYEEALWLVNQAERQAAAETE